jgi:hypothetical protein
MLFLFLLFLFLLFLLRKSRIYKLFPLNGCAIPERGGVYFVELKQRRLQKRTGQPRDAWVQDTSTAMFTFDQGGKERQRRRRHPD